MAAIFLETSALLRMVFAEEEAVEIQERIKKASRIVASRLVRIEAERALIRWGVDFPREVKFIHQYERDLKMLWAKMNFIEISRDICDLAGRIAPGSRLRTLDAIHLATFHRLRQFDPTLEMLTFDRRIREEL